MYIANLTLKTFLFFIPLFSVSAVISFRHVHIRHVYKLILNVNRSDFSIYPIYHFSSEEYHFLCIKLSALPCSSQLIHGVLDLYDGIRAFSIGEWLCCASSSANPFLLLEISQFRISRVFNPLSNLHIQSWRNS